MLMSRNTASIAGEDGPGCCCNRRSAVVASEAVFTSVTESCLLSRYAISSSAGFSSSTASTTRPVGAGGSADGVMGDLILSFTLGSCANTCFELRHPHAHFRTGTRGGVDDEAEVVAERRAQPVIDVRQTDMGRFLRVQ